MKDFSEIGVQEKVTVVSSDYSQYLENGRKRITVGYEKISIIGNEKYFRCEKMDGTYDVYTKQGEKINKIVCTKVKLFDNNVIACETEGKNTKRWLVCDENGKCILAINCDDIDYYYGIYYAIDIKGKKGFINERAVYETELIYKNIWNNRDGSGVVCEEKDGEDIYYLIDSKFQKTSDEYDEMEDFRKGLFAGKKNGLWVFLNGEGEKINEKLYQEVRMTTKKEPGKAIGIKKEKEVEIHTISLDNPVDVNS